MGAYSFEEYGAGKDADTVFRALVEQAQWEHGHGGYTGTIAEKGEFIMVEDEPITWTQAQRQISQWHDSMGRTYTPLKMPAKRRPVYAGFSGGYSMRSIETDGTIEVGEKWGPAGCIEVKRSSIPEKIMKAYFYESVPVTRTETYRDFMGRSGTRTVHTSERRPPKRGTRFFVFFGFAAS